MIQSWIVEQLKPLFPGFEWSVDFEADGDSAATVYYEGGSAPGKFDAKYRYPTYMIWLNSTDWGLTEYAANEIFKALPKIRNVPIEIEYTDKDGNVLGTEWVWLKKIAAVGEPNRLGVEEDKMMYSVNFDVTLINYEGENSNEETINMDIE